ncbi:MAG: DUF4149 domain-containing protein [Nitrospira sp.]|nr:DUF4149 domain-containing protein [Nitrospira sp.]
MEWLALSLWVGGLIVLVGGVIPAVFNTFGGQEIGGVFLTKTFENYQRFLMGSAVVLCGGLAYRRWSGEQIVAVKWSEVVLVGVMVVSVGILVLVLHPQAVSLQEQAFAASGEEAKRAAFEALFRILMPIRILYTVTVVGGVALMVVKAKASLTMAGRLDEKSVARFG